MAKIFTEIKDLEDDEKEEDHWSFQNKAISRQPVTGEIWTSTDVKKRWNWLAILCVKNEPPHIAASMMQPGPLGEDINLEQIGHLLNVSELLT